MSFVSSNTASPNISSPGKAVQVIPAAQMDVFQKSETKPHLNSLFIQPKLTVGAPDDPFEKEADAVADQVMRMPEQGFIQRKCSQCEEEKVKRKPLSQTITPLIQTKSKGNDSVSNAVANRINSSRGGGSALESQTQSFMSSRFGSDFNRVKIHTDNESVQLNRSLKAKAFTVGNDVYFNQGQYQPGSSEGKHLLAHELTHVVQQNGYNDIAPKPIMVGSSGDDNGHTVGQNVNDSILYRSVVPAAETTDEINHIEAETNGRSPLVSASTPHASIVPSPEICPPPPEISCPPALNSPSSVTNTLIFPQNSAMLNGIQQAEVDAVAASWHVAGSSATVRIDGYASAEGGCGYNWDLSCRRAMAVATELKSPIDSSPGVPDTNIELFAHGETAESGPALSPNRMATISIPVISPQPSPPPPTCVFPVKLGSARGCGSGADFAHNDYPSISYASAAKLAAWAAARPFSRGPFRSWVSDFECTVEMDTVLTGLAGASGHAAFSRFEAGTGGTMILGPSSFLGAMALISPSFLATVALVKKSIEGQLATQTLSGGLSPCSLSVTPPATFFSFSDGTPLKAVIGGTQGEELFMTSFSGNSALRSYSIGLRFVICDDFGVDESDLYAPGLFPFWVLQHERSATLYAPFINQLDLPVTVSGSF